MRIQINLEKRFVISSILIAIMIVGIAGVVAYYSDVGDPAVLGHSVDEMDWDGAINSNVTAKGFCIGNETTKSCVNSWATGGVSGVSKIIAGTGVSVNSQTGEVTITATGGGGGVVGTLTYKNCAWVDGGNKPLPQWSLANCSAIGKKVGGFHFYKSNNERENTEYEVTPDYVRARRVSDGSYMQAWAYCCNIETVAAAPPAPSTCYLCGGGESYTCPSGLIKRGGIGKSSLLTCQGGGYPGCASGDYLYCHQCCTA